ncbi:hypothetical protein GR157_14010 [Burkholderia sp. 4701]|nr:hypothetical protein [Burkholderia sp. 4701]MXN85510.1 hypothetical protein [Burkholderia sp. 4812]
MTEHPELAQELIGTVERANALDERGEAAEARKIYIGAWDRLPAPKHEWSLFGQWIPICLFNSSMKSKDYADAREWAAMSHMARPMEDDTASMMQLGAANYELGDMDAAFDWFAKAYAIGARRAFQGFSKKYLDFYLKTAPR